MSVKGVLRTLPELSCRRSNREVVGVESLGLELDQVVHLEGLEDHELVRPAGVDRCPVLKWKDVGNDRSCDVRSRFKH